MRFLVDAQLPPALARRLEALGHATQHVADLDMATAPDSRIREYATATGARVESELPAIVNALERGDTLIEIT